MNFGGAGGVSFKDNLVKQLNICVINENKSKSFSRFLPTDFVFVEIKQEHKEKLIYALFKAGRRKYIMHRVPTQLS